MWAYRVEVVLKSASYRFDLDDPSLEGLYSQASRIFLGGP